jgi:hypothetical protein
MDRNILIASARFLPVLESQAPKGLIHRRLDSAWNFSSVADKLYMDADTDDNFRR